MRFKAPEHVSALHNAYGYFEVVDGHFEADNDLPEDAFTQAGCVRVADEASAPVKTAKPAPTPATAEPKASEA